MPTGGKKSQQKAANIKLAQEHVQCYGGYITDAEDFFKFFAQYLTAILLSNPEVGSEKDLPRAFKIPFEDRSDITEAIIKSIKIWMHDIRDNTSLTIPIPAPLYSLFLPLCNPHVMSAAGVCTISVQSELVDIKQEEKKIALALFGEKGFFKEKWGWHIYSGLAYKDKPSHYLVNHKEKTKKGHKSTKLTYAIDPRQVGRAQLGGQLVGTFNVSGLTNDVLCRYQEIVDAHLKYLPSIDLEDEAKKYLHGYLDITTKAGVPTLSMKERALVCVKLLKHSDGKSILGAACVNFLTYNPTLCDVACFSNILALNKQAEASMGAQPGQIPSPDAYAAVLFAFLCRTNPALIMHSWDGHPEQLFKMIQSLAYTNFDKTLAPMCFAESLNFHRDARMIRRESRSGHDTYVLNILTMGNDSDAPLNRVYKQFAEDIKKTNGEKVFEHVASCSRFLDRIAHEFSSFQVTCHMNSVDTTRYQLDSRVTAIAFNPNPGAGSDIFRVKEDIGDVPITNEISKVHGQYFTKDLKVPRSKVDDLSICWEIGFVETNGKLTEYLSLPSADDIEKFYFVDPNRFGSQFQEDDVRKMMTIGKNYDFLSHVPDLESKISTLQDNFIFPIFNGDVHAGFAEGKTGEEIAIHLAHCCGYKTIGTRSGDHEKKVVHTSARNATGNVHSHTAQIADFVGQKGGWGGILDVLGGIGGTIADAVFPGTGKMVTAGVGAVSKLVDSI